MCSYLIRRLWQAPIVLWVLVTLAFFLMRLAPGGPFDEERDLPPAVEQALAAKYHLDEPVWQQYARFLGDLLQADLGPSFSQPDTPVTRIILAYLPPSLLLGTLALALALSGGLMAGLVAANRRGGIIDWGTMAVALVGLSMPPFVIGPVLVLLCSIWAGWLPPAGYDGWDPRLLLLPAVTLALPFAGRIARLSRAGLLEVLHQDYIRAAEAKGLPRWRIVLVHALPGGLQPVLGFLGPAVASLLTGSLVVELIFEVPGLGRVFVESALARDYTLVMGTVLVYGLFLIVANLLTDLAYGLLDPRIRLA